MSLEITQSMPFEKNRFKVGASVTTMVGSVVRTESNGFQAIPNVKRSWLGRFISELFSLNGSLKALTKSMIAIANTKIKDYDLQYKNKNLSADELRTLESNLVTIRSNLSKLDQKIKKYNKKACWCMKIGEVKGWEKIITNVQTKIEKQIKVVEASSAPNSEKKTSAPLPNSKSPLSIPFNISRGTVKEVNSSSIFTNTPKQHDENPVFVGPVKSDVGNIVHSAKVKEPQVLEKVIQLKKVQVPNTDVDPALILSLEQASKDLVEGMKKLVVVGKSVKPEQNNS